MSGPLAIAGVSAVLRDLLLSGMTAMKLNDSLQDTVPGGVTISVGAPDRVSVDPEKGVSQLNLFLYNLARNPGWANLGLPSHDSRGNLIDNPALGVDLYYLVTAYGAKDFDAEVLLGGALQVLHDTPAFGRDEIRYALQHGTSLPTNVADAGLADQIEQIKISPLPMSTEEIVRLWSAFQCNYRPSVAYLISVVLLQSTRTTTAALPVRQRQVYAVPLAAPQIDSVRNLDDAALTIDPTSTVKIVGENLGLAGMTLWVNDNDLTGGVVNRTAKQMQFKFPDKAHWPAGLYPGTVAVQLKAPQLMGTPAVAHLGVESNVATFVLAPSAAISLIMGSVHVDFLTPVGARQHVSLHLVQSNPPANQPPNTYTFEVPDGNGTDGADATSALDISIPGVAVGSYIAWVSVDDTSSVPDTNPADALTIPP